MRIINLTQHYATPDQYVAGVVDLKGVDREILISLLTFESMPVKNDIQDRAMKIAYLAQVANGDAAMIGGAPFLMSRLTKMLKKAGITPLYAFTHRVVVEQDGIKSITYKHAGFIKA